MRKLGLRNSGRVSLLQARPYLRHAKMYRKRRFALILLEMDSCRECGSSV